MAEKEKLNVWKWLGRARGIDREIDTLQATKNEAREQLTKITQSYQSDGAQSTKDPHKFDRLVELESIIDEKVNELVSVKAEIIAKINELENGKQRTVLIDYYVRCMTLEETAAEMKLSFRQVLRIRKKAVQSLEQQKN